MGSIILFAFPRLGLGLFFSTYKGAKKNYRINLALSNNSVQYPRRVYLWTWQDIYGDRQYGARKGDPQLCPERI